MKILFLFLILLQVQAYCSFIQFGYLGYIAVAATSYYAYQAKCKYFECCEYQSFDFNRLYNIYGQHIMFKIIPNSIQNHVDRTYKSSPLVFLFSGPTGVGKTYTSRLIAETLFEKGLNSINVLKISPSLYFPNPNKKNYYKELIVELLERQIRICPKSLVIIEEIDKVDPDLLEVFHPFLNNYKSEYNEMIYIFITNVSSKEIVEKTLELYSQGKKRDQLNFLDYELIIKKTSYEEKSSLHLSSLVSSNLISYYVPFLPLEQKQILECLRSLGIYSVEKQNFVINQLKWFPNDLKLFSTTGCKQIDHKAAIY